MKTRFHCIVITTCFLLVVLASCQRPVPTEWANEEALLNQLINRQAYAAVFSLLQSPLQSSDPSAPRLRMMWIRKTAEDGHVPLQFELSHVLATSSPSEALRWFAIARIGGILDVARCVEKRRTLTIQALAMKYQTSVRSALADRSKYAAALNEALEWHERHPNRPLPIWICSPVSKAPFSSSGMIPTDQWTAAQVEIKNRIRATLVEDKTDCTEGCQKSLTDPIGPYIPGNVPQTGTIETMQPWP
jgi:hypothetical protein